MKTVWFVFLISAICLEGLGRKYLPQVPAVAFYFLKDVPLVLGWFMFPPPFIVKRTVRHLYRGFGVVLACAIGWTVLELANPEHESIALALIGLRAYWLWWIAPPLVAGMLHHPRQKRRAIYALLIVATGIAVLAAAQFASPANSSLNLYTVLDGQEVYAADQATVASTGRARVAATFTFLSGFVDFCLLIPTLLLSIGLEAKDKLQQRAAFLATLASAAVIPMSGSRGSIMIGALVLIVMMWSSGLFFTRIGRRVLIGSIIATGLAIGAFPEALEGVNSRFENVEESAWRMREVAVVLPPIALVYYDYPLLGIGTGMMQNARASMRINAAYYAEGEVSRYLVELGPLGYLLVWMAKLGLVIALLRAYAILKSAGKRGSAGAALSYAVLTMIGSLTFDHVWQALYFVGCGFILAEVVTVIKERESSPSVRPDRDAAATRTADSRAAPASS